MVGVGGVGSVTCEMLTRCGIGKVSSVQLVFIYLYNHMIGQFGPVGKIMDL